MGERPIEPKTSPDAASWRTVARCAAAGTPVGVMTAPVIPGLNDHQLPDLLSAAVASDVSLADYVPVRLPDAALLFQN
jgi:DNA repair photolyase